MIVFKRSEVARKRLPGRVVQIAVSDQAARSLSDAMTMGFATYSAESGPMEPHRHVEEIVYVLGSEDGWTRHGGFGDEPNELGEKIPLEEGMILHVPEDEWHVFGFEEGGHVDIIFFYARPDVYSQS